jgi:hypothetical protein
LYTSFEDTQEESCGRQSGEVVTCCMAGQSNTPEDDLIAVSDISEPLCHTRH